MVDTRVELSRSISNVLIVQNFPDVFPKDFPGIPLERQVDFRIDLFPDANPITKSPYYLAPPEMH